MSFRLALASLWAPKRVLVEMLDRVEKGTVAALDGLLEKHSPDELAAIRRMEKVPERGLEARRAAMASAQNARVKTLVDAVGKAKAVELGREALYPIGVRLGREAKKEFSVSDSPDELERAARVLYRALGIHFELERRDSKTMFMRVDRCALSHHYSEEACLILSAADEGVVAGLNPMLAMRFEQRMTNGSDACVACIRGAER